METTMSDPTIADQAMLERAPPDRSAPREMGVAVAHGLHGIGLAEGADDRVIRSLSSALEVAEQGEDRYCAEALRLAIAVRWAGLQSDVRSSVPSGEAEPTGRQARALQKWRLKRVIEYVDTHLPNKVRLVDLAAVAGLSRMHFASQFRAATGLRPHEFLLRRRVRRAEELLRDSSMTIVEIALTVGFQTQAHFTTVFKRFVGCPPRHWRIANQLPAVPPVRTPTRAEMTAAL
jgi:AraC family transcriptional regulator